MAASVRGPSGTVAADARRGSVSVGAREIPFRDVAAVLVGYVGAKTETMPTYPVSLDLRKGGSLELIRDEEAFSVARTVAVDFARECGVPIRDASLGEVVVERTPEEWSTTFVERHRDAPPPRPSSTPPGEELTFDVDGMTMMFHSRPGSFRRMWKRPSTAKKATPFQWLIGIIFLPLLLVLIVPLIPFLAIAAAVVYFRTGGKGPILEVSTEGVRLKGLADEWLPAREIVDVEITVTRPAGGEVSKGLLVRSDGKRLDYGASGASDAELLWLRDWVRAIVAGG